MNFKYLTLCLCVLLVNAGCSMSDRMEYSDTEGRIPEQYFHAVKNNYTRKNWIVGNFGNPFAVTPVTDATEIYTYRLAKSRKRHATFFFVFRYGGVEYDVQYFHVLLHQDVVKKAWRDDFEYVDIERHVDRSLRVTQTMPQEPAPQSMAKNTMIEKDAPGADNKKGWLAKTPLSRIMRSQSSSDNAQPIVVIAPNQEPQVIVPNENPPAVAQPQPRATEKEKKKSWFRIPWFGGKD